MTSPVFFGRSGVSSTELCKLSESSLVSLGVFMSNFLFCLSLGVSLEDISSEEDFSDSSLGYSELGEGVYISVIFLEGCVGFLSFDILSNFSSSLISLELCGDVIPIFL